VSVFYTRFSFFCEINELFKCQRIWGQETPNSWWQQNGPTIKMSPAKRKTIKRFFPFYEAGPATFSASPDSFLSVSMRFYEFKKQFTKGIVKGNSLLRLRLQNNTNLGSRAVSASKGRQAGRSVRTQTGTQGPDNARSSAHTYST